MANALNPPMMPDGYGSHANRAAGDEGMRRGMRRIVSQMGWEQDFDSILVHNTYRHVWRCVQACSQSW